MIVTVVPESQAKDFYFFVLFNPLITARKRSLGQGNVFTPVCPANPHLPGRPPPGYRPPPGIHQQAGGTHPTEIYSCLYFFYFSNCEMPFPAATKHTCKAIACSSFPSQIAMPSEIVTCSCNREVG